MGSQVIEPPKLSAGDTIGIIAPATPFTPAVPPAFQAQFTRGVAHLESQGFRVQASPSIKKREQAHLRSPRGAGTRDQ